MCQKLNNVRFDISKKQVVPRVAAQPVSSESVERVVSNNPQALFELGEKYFHGDGVQPDYQEALKWLELSAEQGHYVSQMYLGTMYGRGDLGVPRDLVRAYLWFCLAAAQGSYPTDLAKERRDQVASLMTPAQIAQVRRRATQFKCTRILPAMTGVRNKLCCA